MTLPELEIKTQCPRCGRLCLSGKSDNPEARPFRRAEEGLCGDCAVTHFLMCPEMEPMKNNLLNAGLDALKNLNIQEVFESMLLAGKSELTMEEINWENVINNWDLPFPRKYK